MKLVIDDVPDQRSSGEDNDSELGDKVHSGSEARRILEPNASGSNLESASNISGRSKTNQSKINRVKKNITSNSEESLESKVSQSNISRRSISKQRLSFNMNPSGAKLSKSKRKNQQSKVEEQKRGKPTLSQKLIKLYPDISAKNKIDEVLGRFVAQRFRDPFKGAEIQPDMIDYNYPDFGFDNTLQFMSDEQVGEMSSNWRFFIDYCSPFPKFERLNNYIQFANAEKLERLMKDSNK